MANTAKKNLNLHVVVARVPAGNNGWRKRRGCTCSGISLGAVLTAGFRGICVVDMMDFSIY